MSLYEELKERGLIYQQTTDDLKNLLQKPLTFYCGFDPTSDSLHIGSLLPLITMRRFQLAGHRPLILLGGATGMIGDPSFKSKERVLLGKETIEENIKGIFKNVQRVLSFEGDNAARLVNNIDWIGGFSFIDFLRDVGKHFTVNAMLAKDSVKARIESREQGISYAEFSYALIQSYDFYYLHQKMGCTLQMGASDQWGNITSGVDLVRRMQGDSQEKDICYGMTFPLITKADGTKFGKTESGNVWLNPEKTSPYQFYQFFLRLGDDEAVKLLLYFSLQPLADVRSCIERFRQEPHRREVQKNLARELTIMIHGEEEFQKAERASQALFSGDFTSLDEKLLMDVFSDAPSKNFSNNDSSIETLVDLLVATGLCSSKGMARKDIQAGAISVNNQKVTDETLAIKDTPRLFHKLMILRKGKKNYFVVRFQEGL